MIELKNVSKTFDSGTGEVDALKNVSLTIEDGDIYGIIGMSGAGKSTLVRCINLLERPTSGEVIVNGEHLDTMSPAQLRAARRDITMIFQHFNLLMQRTCLKNICFPMEISGVKKADAEEKARELLELVGLPDKADAYPAQLSGGQKQRIAIARALATNPKVLLCDEATSALDLETTEGILALLKRINTELGVTIVFITHQLEVAQRVFDRVAVMEDGAIIEQGTTFDVFAEPRHGTTQALVERFLGVAIPERLVPQLPAGRLVELRYKGDHAFEPLISAVSNRHGVAVNVLHGNVEYFGTQPIGTLVVLVSAIREGQRGARDVEAALDELRGKVFGFQELTDAAVEDALGAQYSGGAHGTGQGTTRREVLV